MIDQDTFEKELEKLEDITAGMDSEQFTDYLMDNLSMNIILARQVIGDENVCDALRQCASVIENEKNLH